METVRTDKTVLRRMFQDLRRGYAQTGGAKAGQQLGQNIHRFLRDFSDVQCCLYRARPDEAPCVAEPIQNFYYPVLNGETLEFRRPHSAKAFRLSSLKIEEPISEESTPLDTGAPMVVMCPAVAIDGTGVRLGMGKGYYDRFFDQYPHALRVGVVFHIQFSTDPLPAESWDQKLDWVVSEKMILRTSTRSSQSWI